GETRRGTTVCCKWSSTRLSSAARNRSGRWWSSGSKATRSRRSRRRCSAPSGPWSACYRTFASSWPISLKRATEMVQGAVPRDGAELDSFIEAYESAQARDGTADLAAFLPPEGHPLRLRVLRELVRVGREYGGERGRPTPLEDYRRRFPELFADRESLRAIAFEEYRLRRQAGQVPSLAEYRDGFGVSVADWPRSTAAR